MKAKDVLREELEALKTGIITRHIGAGQKASGRSADSFEVRMTGNASGELWANSYVGVFERGRKPGRIPRDMKQIIIDWAAAKGITFSDSKQLERFANAVAWNIRLNGTVLYRSPDKPDIFDAPLRDFETRLTERLPEALIVEIKNFIFTNKN